MNQSEVTVCCITYNHARFIQKAIESFLSQKTEFPFDILIHDDCSTDGTVDILKRYEAAYPNLISVIYENENQYSKTHKSITANYVIPHAKGKYIALCEGDDFWNDPLKLQKQYDILEHNLDCAFCFHDAQICDTHGKILEDSMLEEKPKYKNCTGKYTSSEIIDLDFCPTASLFFRRDCLNIIPEYFNNGVCGDLPLRLTLAAHGNAYCINESMSTYRTGNSNSASGRIANNNKKIAHTLEVHCEILNEFDLYTGEKLHGAVLNQIKNKQFQKLIILGDIKQLKSAEFRDLYNNLKLRTKAKCYLLHYSPTIYFSLSELLRKLKKRES